MVERKIESIEDAMDFIDNLDNLSEEHFRYRPVKVVRQENVQKSPTPSVSMHSSGSLSSLKKEKEEKKTMKKPRMPTNLVKEEIVMSTETSDSDEKSKERKRTNRVNANRNDYGNEGFLMMLLYYLGCCISLTKLQKDGTFQKLRITEISYNGKKLLDREEIEEDVSKIDIPAQANLKRDKNIITSIKTDNKLLDILRDEFELVYDEDVKKKPEKKYMPGRRVLERIQLSQNYEKKDIVDEGVKFYDYLKEYGKKNKMIFVSKAYVERCWSEGIPVASPESRSAVFTDSPVIAMEEN